MSKEEEETKNPKKREKTIKEIYMEQATIVAKSMIEKVLDEKNGLSIKEMVVGKLLESIEKFRGNGNSLVDIQFGNYKGKPFVPLIVLEVPVAEAIMPEEAAKVSVVQAAEQPSAAVLTKKPLPVATPITGGKRKRQTRRKQQRGGGQDPTELFGEIIDKILVPQLLKLPVFVAEILIPIASTQMRKVILKHSAENEKLMTQFILDSVEINLILLSKKSEDWKKTFDANMIKLIREDIVIRVQKDIEPPTLQVPEEKKGGGVTDVPEEKNDSEIKNESLAQLLTNLLTQKNTEGMTLAAQLFQIADKFPKVFEVIDVIPKSVDDFFTIKMFEQVIHQAICEEVYQIMTEDGLLTKIKETICEFPNTLALKGDLTYKDFIKTKKTRQASALNPAPTEIINPLN
uniref:Uncharacterized protein n=1 Tax=viral metagenome TaxID=1070528 RepID=A0A6C0HIA4_9ZZZZ